MRNSVKVWVRKGAHAPVFLWSGLIILLGQSQHTARHGRAPPQPMMGQASLVMDIFRRRLFWTAPSQGSVPFPRAAGMFMPSCIMFVACGAMR